MVATGTNTEAEERERLQPYVAELLTMLREFDPALTYVFGPGPDGGIWVLDVFLQEPLDEDFGLHEAVSERAVDFQVNEGMTIAVVPHRR